MLQSEFQFKTNVALGAHAIVIVERQRKIQCPCCSESKALETVYSMRERLVLSISTRFQLYTVAPVLSYQFHKLNGSICQDRVFPDKKSAALAIKKLRQADKDQMKHDIKTWRRRQKEKRNW